MLCALSNCACVVQCVRRASRSLAPTLGPAGRLTCSVTALVSSTTGLAQPLLRSWLRDSLTERDVHLLIKPEAFGGLARKQKYNLQMSEAIVDPETAIRSSKHGFAIDDYYEGSFSRRGANAPFGLLQDVSAASGRCVSKGQAGVWGSSVRNGVKLPSRLISSCCVPAEAARGNCWGGVHQRSDDPPSLLMVPDPQGQHKLRHKEI